LSKYVKNDLFFMDGQIDSSSDANREYMKSETSPSDFYHYTLCTGIQSLDSLVSH